MNEETRQRIEQIDNEGEKKVAVLLSNMGFDLVDFRVEIPDSPKPKIGEIDLVFESGHTLLLIEVSTGKNAISDKQWAFFCKWSNNQAVAALTKRLGKQSHKITRTYFDLRQVPENIGGPEAVGIAKPGSTNMICYQKDFERLGDRGDEDIKGDFVQALSDDPDSSRDARRKLGIGRKIDPMDETVNA